MPAAILLAALLAPSGLPPAPPRDGHDGSDAERELQAVLAELVDLPTRTLRASRARAVASRADVDTWLRAMGAFGEFEPAEPGSSRVVFPLDVGARRPEETELCLYVPAAYDPRVPAPLLLVAHGTGGSGRGLPESWRGPAEELGMLVLAPSEAGANDGYGFTERERRSALSALRWARRRFNVDEDRVLATGISRGGHLVWDLALRHPDLFAGLAPMIGGPRITLQEGQNNLRYLENVVHLPIRDLQGTRDDPGLVFNVRLAFERLEALGAPDARLIEFPELGHAFDAGAVDWTAFLGACRRRPRPERVVRAAAREGEGRAFWVEVTRTAREVDEEFRPTFGAEEWGRADDAGRRRLLQAAADERTGRLEVVRLGPGRFRARASLVERFRLLLEPGDLPAEGRVEVELDGELRRLRARADARVLLAEFAERFDRSFLPVAEVEVR